MLDRLFRRDKSERHEHGPFADPVTFGNGTKPAPDVVVRTIRRNAGKVSPAELALCLGVSVKTVERLAREWRIPLAYPQATETATESENDPRGA